MTELLVGTKKGLFRLEGNGGGFEITARAFAGQSVEYAMRDPRTGRYLASVTSWFYGPRIWVTDDPTGEWEQAEGTTLPEGEEQALERLWVIVPGEADGVLYAGGDPGPLFESRDGGLTWSLNRGLWDHPTRPDWSPGNGGLCLHTIAPWHGRPVAPPRRNLVGRGLALGRRRRDVAALEHRDRARLPPRRGTRQSDPALRPRRPPLPAKPERLFMQFHGGVYRSDDAGENWIDVGDGLPSDFGFPIVVDPSDPDSAYVIPLIGAEDRTTARRRRPRVGDARRGRDVDPARRRPSRSSPTSRSCGRRSTTPARASAWSSTSARRRVRCSARPTPARAGGRWPTTCRRCTRCGRPRGTGTAGACPPRRALGSGTLAGARPLPGSS